MDACCDTKAEELNTLREKHRKVLILVLAINAVLFIVEAIAGFLAHSTALLRLADMLATHFLRLQPLCPFGEARNGRRAAFSKALSRCLVPVY